MNVLRIDAVKMRQGANACVPEESLILANHGSTNTRHRKHTLRRRSAVLLAMRKQAFCALRSATPVPRGVWTRRCCGEQSAAFANAKSSVFVAVAWDFWQISISTAKCRFRIARICRNGKIFVPFQRHFVPTFCGLPFPDTGCPYIGCTVH